ncbi:MAG: winged helix-turn-helix domain-containing protein, partial [Promethearchaeota archaeon]
MNFNLVVKSVPDDFELILKGLSNKFRFALTLLFLDKGNLSFSEIVSITNRSKSLIASHLKKLELGGILQNFLKKESGS